MYKSISAKVRDFFVKVSYPLRGTARVKQGSTITYVNVVAGKDVRDDIINNTGLKMKACVKKLQVLRH